MASHLATCLRVPVSFLGTWSLGMAASPQGAAGRSCAGPHTFPRTGDGHSHSV